MAMTLYEINMHLEKVLTEGISWDEETGEILFDEDSLEQLELDRKEKIEGTALFLKNLLAEANAINEEKAKLDKRQKQKEKAVERLKEYLAYNLTSAKQSKFETGKVLLSFRKSEAVEISNIELLPKKYIRTVTKEEANRTAIKQAIKDGQTVSGAELITKMNLQIK